MESASKNFFQNGRDAFFKNFVVGDSVRAEFGGFGVVICMADRAAYADLHIFALADQFLFDGVAEGCSVTVRETFELFFPGVEVRVDVDEGERTKFFGVRA